jgi:hypothetical protein
MGEQTQKSSDSDGRARTPADEPQVRDLRDHGPRPVHGLWPLASDQLAQTRAAAARAAVAAYRALGGGWTN